MKTLNITFDDKEFKRIKKAKELADADSWRDWILMLVEWSRRR